MNISTVWSPGPVSSEMTSHLSSRTWKSEPVRDEVASHSKICILPLMERLGEKMRPAHSHQRHFALSITPYENMLQESLLVGDSICGGNTLTGIHCPLFRMSGKCSDVSPPTRGYNVNVNYTQSIVALELRMAAIHIP